MADEKLDALGIGFRIYSLMKEQKYTCEYVSHDTRIPPSYIKNTILGKSCLSTDEIRKVAKTLHTSFTYITYGKLPAINNTQVNTAKEHLFPAGSFENLKKF